VRRPSASSVLGVLVSAVSLAAVAWWISRQEAPRLPDSSSGYAWLALAMAVIAGNFVLRGLRWHGVLRYSEVPHRLRDAVGLTLVGYMGNNVLPARGGELLKIGIMGSRTPARHREVLGTVVAERVLDAAVLAAVFAVLTWASVEGAPTASGSGILAAAVLAAAALGLAVYLWLRRRGRFERFAATIRPVARASKLFARPAGVPLAALSLVIWSLDGLSFMLMARALDVELAFLSALAVVVLASLAAAIPAAPGYLGTFDAAMVVGLNGAGIEGGSAVSLLLLARFMYFVPVTLAGLATLVLGYGGEFRRRDRVAVGPPRARDEELLAG
jgi:glycosyltransferase 2 family protein